MHLRPHKLDGEATAARNFVSPYSYISRRVHPGTNHQCEYLGGFDKTMRRKQIFERDEYRCVDCGERITWENGEWAHGGKTKLERCDCIENGKTKCHSCHVKEHSRYPRFGEKVEA